MTQEDCKPSFGDEDRMPKFDDKAAIATSAFLAAKRTSDLFGVGLPTKAAYAAVAADWTNLTDGGQ